MRNSQLIKLFSLLILSSSVFFTSCSKDAKQPETQTGSEKSGGNSEKKATNQGIEKSANSGDNFKIDYKLEGVISGNMSVSKSGNFLKQLVSTDFLGVRSSSTNYIINDTVFSVTEAAGKTAGKKLKLSDFNKNNPSGSAVADIKDFQKFIENKKLIGTENILGYACDVYETGPEMSLSVYDKKYILRIRIPSFQAVAEKLEMNPSFAANEFLIPENVNFKNDYSKKMDPKEIENMIKNLKK